MASPYCSQPEPQGKWVLASTTPVVVQTPTTRHCAQVRALLGMGPISHHPFPMIREAGPVTAASVGLYRARGHGRSERHNYPHSRIRGELPTFTLVRTTRHDKELR